MIIHDTEIKGNMIRVELDDDEILQLSVDDYYELGCFKGMEVDDELLKELRSRADLTRIFQRALHKLSAKDRTTYEMRQWLIKDVKADSDIIETVIDKLMRLGYLDDERYVQSAISSLKASYKGEGKIIYTLKQNGLDEKLIKEVLSTYHDEEENARIYGQKIIRAHTKDSLRHTKDTVKMKLIQQGYSSEVAQSVLNQLDYDDIIDHQEESLRLYIHKMHKRYMRRFHGKQLRNKIYQACLLMGYSGSMITSILDETEFEDEED